MVLGYSAIEVGLAFLPANLIMGAFSLGLSAKLVMRFGIRAPLAAVLVRSSAAEPSDDGPPGSAMVLVAESGSTIDEWAWKYRPYQRARTAREGAVPRPARISTPRIYLWVDATTPSFTIPSEVKVT